MPRGLGVQPPVSRGAAWQQLELLADVPVVVLVAGQVPAAGMPQAPEAGRRPA